MRHSSLYAPNPTSPVSSHSSLRRHPLFPSVWPSHYDSTSLCLKCPSPTQRAHPSLPLADGVYFLTPNSVHTSDRLALHYLYTVTSPSSKSISKVEPKASSYFYPQCPPQAGTLEDMEKHVLHGWLTSHVESNHLLSSLFFPPHQG